MASIPNEQRGTKRAGRRKRSKALNRDLLKLCERYGATELGPRIVALAELLQAAHSRIALRDGGNGSGRRSIPGKAGRRREAGS